MLKKTLILLMFVGPMLLVSPVAAQEADVELAKVPLNNYLRGHATGDPAFILKAFHQDARIMSMREGRYTSLSVDEFARLFTWKPGPDEAQRKRTIERLDVTGTAASATIVLDYPAIRFVDYMSLLKIDGEWKIVNKSFHAERKQNQTRE
jgi:hypothetical protein